jgi:hypothetical protein
MSSKRVVIKNRDDALVALLLEHGPLTMAQIAQRTGYKYTTIHMYVSKPPFVLVWKSGYFNVYGLKCHLSLKKPEPLSPKDEAPQPAPVIPTIDPALADMICDQVKLARAVGVLALDGDKPLTAAIFVRWQQQKWRVQSFLGIRYDNEEEE